MLQNLYFKICVCEMRFPYFLGKYELVCLVVYDWYSLLKYEYLYDLYWIIHHLIADWRKVWTLSLSDFWFKILFLYISEHTHIYNRCLHLKLGYIVSDHLDAAFFFYLNKITLKIQLLVVL